MATARPLRIVHVTTATVGAPWLLALAVEQRRLGHDARVVLPSLGGELARQLAERRVRTPAAQRALTHAAVAQRAFARAPADGPRVRRELGLAAGAPVVGMVPYFYPPVPNLGMGPRCEGRGLKGHDVLLRAVPCVLAAVPD